MAILYSFMMAPPIHLGAWSFDPFELLLLYNLSIHLHHSYDEIYFFGVHNMYVHVSNTCKPNISVLPTTQSTVLFLCKFLCWKSIYYTIFVFFHMLLYLYFHFCNTYDSLSTYSLSPVMVREMMPHPTGTGQQ